MTDEPEVPAEGLILPELTPVELDALMGKDPLSLSQQDLAQIVKYHRKQRARRAKGEVVVEDKDKPKIDLKAVLSTIVGANKPPAEPLKRRG